MGYLLMAARKSKDFPDFLAPLSFGRGNEPDPEQLLMRGRGTLFETELDARTALAATLKKATEDGCKWPSKFIYSTIEIESALTANTGAVQK